MDRATRQAHPLEPRSSIAKSFCRYRGRPPYGLPVNEGDREARRKAGNVDAT